MRIRILKKIEYKNCPVYIQRLDKVFQYLILFNNEIYSQYLEIKPSWYRRFLNEPFTKEQLENCARMAIEGAEITIDELLKKKHAKSKKGDARKLER